MAPSSGAGANPFFVAAGSLVAEEEEERSYIKVFIHGWRGGGVKGRATLWSIIILVLAHG